MTNRSGAAISDMPVEPSEIVDRQCSQRVTLTLDIADLRVVDAVGHKNVQELLAREIVLVLEELHRTVRTRDILVDQILEHVNLGFGSILPGVFHPVKTHTISCSLLRWPSTYAS